MRHWDNVELMLAWRLCEHIMFSIGIEVKGYLVRHQRGNRSTDFMVIQRTVLWSEQNNQKSGWKRNLCQIFHHVTLCQAYKSHNWAFHEVHGADEHARGLSSLGDPVQDVMGGCHRGTTTGRSTGRCESHWWISLQPNKTRHSFNL